MLTHTIVLAIGHARGQDRVRYHAQSVVHLRSHSAGLSCCVRLCCVCRAHPGADQRAHRSSPKWCTTCSRSEPAASASGSVCVPLESHVAAHLASSFARAVLLRCAAQARVRKLPVTPRSAPAASVCGGVGVRWAGLGTCVPRCRRAFHSEIRGRRRLEFGVDAHCPGCVRAPLSCAHAAAVEARASGARTLADACSGWCRDAVVDQVGLVPLQHVCRTGEEGHGHPDRPAWSLSPVLSSCCCSWRARSSKLTLVEHLGRAVRNAGGAAVFADMQWDEGLRDESGQPESLCCQPPPVPPPAPRADFAARSARPRQLGNVGCRGRGGILVSTASEDVAGRGCFHR